MKNLIINEIAKPLFRRIGSISAGGLLTLGATHELANQVEVSATALAAFVLDLLLSHWSRK